MKHKGKVALVPGAIKGIGREIGLALADEGMRLALNYFDWEESLDEMRQVFADTGAEHIILRTDLRDTEAVPGLIRQVTERFGRLDILINNIERGGWPAVHGPYTRQQWDLEQETTLRAKQWLFAAALPHLKASGDGTVINFSSIAGICGRSGPASHIFNEGYAAANRGISLLTETWARLGAPEVRVNEIMLGFFETRHAEKTRGWGLLSEEQKQALLDHILLQRTGRTADAVKAVRFLLHDAPYMTGAVLRLDGGYILGGEKIAPMPEGVV
ncbi:MAG: SDR family oxidoreductase [Desulfococcaceae bacterium]|jgi:3-oxoacyl-[acyl-carrier protein] reductase|nr:SDR family oxidoreductase [Desulfococcaceae bacterium]